MKSRQLQSKSATAGHFWPFPVGVGQFWTSRGEVLMTFADGSASKGARPVRPVPHEIDTSRVPLAEAETPADFGLCLEQARTLAGPLSNREIESRSGGLLGRTKIGHVLAGTLPRREFLDLYLQICGVRHHDRPQWYETWERLAHTPRMPGTRQAGTTGEGRAAAIIDQAEAKAAQITEQATAVASEITARAAGEVDHLMAQARTEAERLRESDNSRFEAAENERDSAMSRARMLTFELDEMHKTSLERVRAADDERDTALARARSLADELAAMHEASLARVRAAEDERDEATARARSLSLELDTLHSKIANLREKLNSRTYNDEIHAAESEIRSLRDQLEVLSEGARSRRINYADNGDFWALDRKAAPPAIGQ